MKIKRLPRLALICVLFALAAAAQAQPQASLTPILTGLTQPVFLTHAGDGTGRLFIVEQPGTIRIATPNGDGTFTLLPTPFLDITFHPDYARNGRFFVNFTAASPRRTIIAEYQRSSDPDIALTTAKLILEFTQPQDNHNGGWIGFGPTDGYLYIASGDGGGGGDSGTGHEPTVGNGQFLGTLLGKILRIDINTTGTYLIPPSNPFISTGGALPEIYAYGLRNPWRCSFDSAPPHALYAGDVGQTAREEIDIIVSGANYGWRITEGTICYNPSSGCDFTGITLPIHDYDRSQSDVAVTGGYVAHSPSLPSYEGQYIFGDYASGRVWALNETAPDTWQRTLVTTLGFTYRTASFGEDESGEIYLCDRGGRILRLAEPPQSSASHFSYYE